MQSEQNKCQTASTDTIKRGHLVNVEEQSDLRIYILILKRSSTGQLDE